MSLTISDCIINYAGDFAVPKYHDTEAWKELKGKYKLTSEWDIQERIKSDKGKAADLLTRVIESEYGAFEVEDFSSDTPKKVTLKVTRYIGRHSFEYYTAWLDGDFPSQQGLIKLEVAALRPSGMFWSRYWGDVHQDDYEAYAKGTLGFIIIDELSAPGSLCQRGKLRGTGSGLLQIAAEVSHQHGFGLNLCLKSAYDSPGFYRKAHLNSSAQHKDIAIDAELEKAKNEKRKPDTSKYTGSMFLKEGRAHYEQLIALKPILKKSVTSKLVLNIV